MRGRQWRTFAMATVAAVALSACAGGDEAAEETPATETPAQEETATAQPEAPVNLPEGVTQEQYTQGEQLFTGQGGCAACHGPDATGTQLGPDLTDGEWINISGRNYDEIVELINTGVAQPQEHPGPMPPMGGQNLTEAQVQALAAYIAGLGQG